MLNRRSTLSKKSKKCYLDISWTSALFCEVGEQQEDTGQVINASVSTDSTNNIYADIIDVMAYIYRQLT